MVDGRYLIQQNASQM